MNSHWFQQPFCQAFPMAHLMRKVFPQCWLRIHSLPDSKRYPESEVEREIILDRYARFGSALLGDHAPCVIIRSLFISNPSGGKSPPPLDWERTDHAAELMPGLTWTQIHRVNDEDDEAWDSWLAPMTWNASTLRTLLLEIAEDRREHIAFLSDITDSVFAPYDGGADGFTSDKALLRRLVDEFASWRSILPSGL